VETAEKVRARFREISRIASQELSTAPSDVAAQISVVLLEGLSIADDDGAMRRLDAISGELQVFLDQAARRATQEKLYTLQGHLDRAGQRREACQLGQSLADKAATMSPVVSRIRSDIPAIGELYDVLALVVDETLDQVTFDIVSPESALHSLSDSKERLSHLSGTLMAVLQATSNLADRTFLASVQATTGEQQYQEMWQPLFRNMIAAMDVTADLWRSNHLLFRKYDQYYAACSRAEKAKDEVTRGVLSAQAGCTIVRQCLIELRAMLRSTGYDFEINPDRAYVKAFLELQEAIPTASQSAGTADTNNTANDDAGADSAEADGTDDAGTDDSADGGRGRDAGATLDPYEELGVASTATEQDLLDAYRTKVQQYHPDLFAHEDHVWVRQEAAAKMTRINEAWDLLSTPETRATYDAARRRHEADDLG